MSAPGIDRDAVLSALQDQIDDLTVALSAHQKLLDAHGSVIIELARLAGLGDATPVVRPPRRRGGGDG